MFTVVGHCPHCGAPIYTSGVWMGVTPPPNYYSCNCRLNGLYVKIVPSENTADVSCNYANHCDAKEKTILN